MFPSTANMYLAPIEDDELHHERTDSDFWQDVYGFDFSPLR